MWPQLVTPVCGWYVWLSCLSTMFMDQETAEHKDWADVLNLRLCFVLHQKSWWAWSPIACSFLPGLSLSGCCQRGGLRLNPLPHHHRVPATASCLSGFCGYDLFTSLRLSWHCQDTAWPSVRNAELAEVLLVSGLSGAT